MLKVFSHCPMWKMWQFSKTRTTNGTHSCIDYAARDFYTLRYPISIRVWGIASFIRLGLATTFYMISGTTPRLNRNLKFIILIISNAITGILCIGTVKFPLFLFFKRQNSVRSTILFRFTEKIETPIRKAVSYKEVAFLLPLQNIFPWLTNKLLGNLLFI